MSTVQGGLGRQPARQEQPDPAELFAQNMLTMITENVHSKAQYMVDRIAEGESLPSSIVTWQDLQERYLRPSQNHLRMGIADAKQGEHSAMFSQVADALEAHADTFFPVSFYDEFDPLADVNLSDPALNKDSYVPEVAEETAACVELVAILAMHEVVAYEDPTALKYVMEALMQMRENFGTTRGLTGRTFLSIMEFLKRAMIVAEVERIQGISPEEAGHTKDLSEAYVEVFMIQARATGESAFRP